MKISIVMGFFLPVPALAGGATEKIWHRLGAIMAEEGHDVTIISREWPGLPFREQHGRLAHVRLPGWSHTRWLPVNLLLDFLWALRVVRSLPHADVVVCNTVTLPLLLRWFRPTAGRVAVVLGRMPKGQVRFYGCTDTLLATSTEVAKRAAQENPRVAGRVFVFPNPIDWTMHHNAAAQSTVDQGIRIGFVGRIHPEKGLELLLQAAGLLLAEKDIPHWQVVLVGPVAIAQGGGGANFLRSLEKSFRPLLGDRLVILPPEFVPDKLARLYGSFDIFCYPSIADGGETFGIAVAEAMAAGAVPVVSDLACFRDLVVPSVCGLTFDHHNQNRAVVLADLLRSLIIDSALRRRLRLQAQESSRRFDFTVAARHLLAHFEQLVRNPLSDHPPQ